MSWATLLERFPVFPTFAIVVSSLDERLARGSLVSDRSRYGATLRSARGPGRPTWRTQKSGLCREVCQTSQSPVRCSLEIFPSCPSLSSTCSGRWSTRSAGSETRSRRPARTTPISPQDRHGHGVELVELQRIDVDPDDRLARVDPGVVRERRAEHQQLVGLVHEPPRDPRATTAEHARRLADGYPRSGPWP